MRAGAKVRVCSWNGEEEEGWRRCCDFFRFFLLFCWPDKNTIRLNKNHIKTFANRIAPLPLPSSRSTRPTLPSPSSLPSPLTAPPLIAFPLTLFLPPLALLHSLPFLFLSVPPSLCPPTRLPLLSPRGPSLTATLRRRRLPCFPSSTASQRMICASTAAPEPAPIPALPTRRGSRRRNRCRSVLKAYSNPCWSR